MFSKTRGSVLLLLALVYLCGAMKYMGVNLAGAEFGTSGSPPLLVPYPGNFRFSYIYPEPEGYASHFTKSGMNIFRLPFRWERLQNSLGGPIVQDEMLRLRRAVNSITAHNVHVILDPHNYGRFHDKIIGEQILRSHFVNFWKLLANEFKNNDRVIFGLINEPHRQDTAIWAQSANETIAGIRDTGATNFILVPGNRWSGGHSWMRADEWGISNAEAMLRISDSADNYAIEVHQYFDSDYSGTKLFCSSASIGRDSLVQVTEWAKQNNQQLFLGEYGAGQIDPCRQTVENMLDYMEQNTDVWLGATWWAAGPWWGNYFMSIEPDLVNNVIVDKPQMQWLAKYLNRDSIPVTASPTPTPTTAAPPATEPPANGPSGPQIPLDPISEDPTPTVEPTRIGTTGSTDSSSGVSKDAAVAIAFGGGIIAAAAGACFCFFKNSPQRRKPRV